MKRAYIFLSTLFALMQSLTSLAQTNYYYLYQPLAVEGREWLLDDGSRYFIKGDTIVNGENFKKLYFVSESDTCYCCALVDKGKQVYQLEVGDDTPCLLYDFGGDWNEIMYERSDSGFYQVHNGWKSYFPYKNRWFANIDVYLNIGLGGDYSDMYASSSARWIEGIGTSHSHPFDRELVGMGDSPAIVECYQDGELIFNKMEAIDAFVSHVFSSAYNPITTTLIEEGKNWNETVFFIDGTQEHTYDLHVDEGQRVSGYECKTLLKSILANESGSQVQNYSANIFEEHGRVYFLKDGNPRLLYDFSAEPHSDIPIYKLEMEKYQDNDWKPEKQMVHVDSVVCKDVNGYMLRHIYISATSDDEKVGTNCWVEKIGSYLGFEKNYVPFDENEKDMVLNQCQVNGIIYYERNTSSIAVDATSISSNSQNIYDLTGRPVISPTKGIYIQNGKKVMVK